MNLLLLFESDHVVGDRFRVADDRARHVREVLRSEVGDALRVGLLEGPLGSGVVTSLDDAGLELDVTFEGAAPPRAPTDMILAVPRPQSVRKLLPQVTALGVDRIVLVRTARVERAFVDARLLTPAGLAPLLHDGLMQARCTRAPRVRVEPRFRPYVEDRAAAEFAPARRFVAHPSAARLLSDLVIERDERVVVAVGPEGGFVPFEVELLSAAGFEPVSLGPRVLRVETACVALLSQIELLRQIGGARRGHGLGGDASCGSLATS